MENVEWVVSFVSGLLWDKVLWVLILGAGLYLSVRLSFLQITKLAFSFRLLWQARSSPESKSGISPFNALMVSLSATVGTGNIAGVATAIAIGGPGALFWMWCSAVFGMATKYAEAVCAVHYREKNSVGEYVGGPMYYIKNGLGKKWMGLAFAFALFGSLAGFGIGNAVQANSIAGSLSDAFGLSRVLIASVLMLLVGLVILGGVKSIAKTAKSVVPIMSILYLIAGLTVILMNLSEVPRVLALVIDSAFTGTAAQGGFAGAAVALAIQMGIARGVFSNEAGLGSAPIAHAAAETDSPVKQGCIAMLGTFIDTLVICSITGLAILVTGSWLGDAQGAAMSQAAFASAIPYGDKLVSISLSVFAFTTILGWSYYGERCAEFIFGSHFKLFSRTLKTAVLYRILWVSMIPIGVFAGLKLVWSISDVLNGLMAIPNIIALFALTGVVVSLTQKHFKKELSDA